MLELPSADDSLADMLLDIRTVFDPLSIYSRTLSEAVGSDARNSAAAWVAVAAPGGGTVVEHVLGQRTQQLDRLVVHSGRGMTGRVFESSALHWVDDYTTATSITHHFDEIIVSERIRRMIAAPLRVADQVEGVLTVGRRDDGDFGDIERKRIEQIAERASLALGIARANRDGARAAALAERRRISEELHDGVGALMFSLSSRVDRLQRSIRETDPQSELSALQGELAEVNRLVRSLMTGWHAQATEDVRAEVQGLTEDFEKRSGIPTTCVVLGSIPNLDEARQMAVMRLIGVALANVERHASATAATVTLACVPSQLSVAISNDGPVPDEVIPGIGLSGASERINRLGGELTTISDPKEGFIVRARIPL